MYRGFVGGRGAGKTWVGAYDLIRRARRDRTYLAGSPTGTLMQDTTFPTFESVAKSLGVWAGAKMTPWPTVRIRTQKGIAKVRFRTAEDPEKMRGPNLSGVWLDEASLMPEEAYTISIASLREAGEQGWFSATFTPKGLAHWTYDVFGKDPRRPDTALFHAATRDNPFLPDTFHDTLAHQYSPALAQQELAGLFVDMGGAEFPPEWFGPNVWVDRFPDGLALRVIYLDPSVGRNSKSGDYGAFSLLGRDPGGMLYVACDLAQRRPMPATVATGLRLAREFGPLDGFGVESNAFQELMADEFARQSRESGVMLPLYKINNYVNKQVRIRRLTPYLSRGNIRFVEGEGTRLAVRQLMQFPLGDHDDAPDAIEGSIRLAVSLYNGRQAEANRKGRGRR